MCEFIFVIFLLTKSFTKIFEIIKGQNVRIQNQHILSFVIF